MCCFPSFVRSSIFCFCDTSVLVRGFYQIQWWLHRMFYVWDGENGEDPQNAKQEILESCYHLFRSPHTSKIHRRIPDKGQRAGRPEVVGEEKRKGKKANLTHTLRASATSVCRSWQADSVDSGCSSCAQTSPPHPEPCCVGSDPLHGHAFAGQADPFSPEKLQPPPLKVSGKAQGTFGAPPMVCRPAPGTALEGGCVCPPPPRNGRGWVEETDGMKLTGSNMRAERAERHGSPADSPCDSGCGGGVAVGSEGCSPGAFLGEPRERREGPKSVDGLKWAQQVPQKCPRL